MSEKYSGKVSVENRRFPRVQFNLGIHYAPVKEGELPKPVECKAEDMGAGGMAMYSEHKLEIGDRLTVNLYIPPVEKYINSSEIPMYNENECVPITLLAKVAWCCADEKNGFRAGIQFLDVDKKNAKQLKHFLVEYELDEPIT
jgi:c-di-GMP-binding flagellar brake protein YcgR